MIIVYKIPEAMQPEALKEFIGLEGSTLNPIQDADGNWVVSEQEWYAQEFQFLKDKYPELAAQFTPIEWKKPPVQAGPPVKV